MDITEYVKDKFGKDQCTKMINIRRGGDNNNKGNRLEEFFAVNSIVKIIATSTDDDISNIIVVAQDPGFVDDFVIKDKVRDHKTNYQIKNSAGVAANWTGEMQDRFEMQQDLDTGYHNFGNASQVLLVSDSAKQKANAQALTKLGNSAFKSQFFPDAASTFELLNRSEELRTNMEQICGEKNLSTLDQGVRVVLGEWKSSSDERSIADIFQGVRDMSKPDIFKSGTKLEPPRWLLNTAEPFNNIEIVVKSVGLSVRYNGFEVNIFKELEEPSQLILSGVSNELKFIELLLSLTQDDYKQI
tara:strand:- start:35898 stop:36797 length:900 start_codon:yes stop_codon:yes gene_type:complete